MEPVPAPGVGPVRSGGDAARAGRPFPQRHRRRRRRPADPDRGPLRQPGGALPADPAGSGALRGRFGGLSVRGGDGGGGGPPPPPPPPTPPPPPPPPARGAYPRLCP